MDWKPLLEPTVAWRGALLTAAAVDARVNEARARFRSHLQALGRLERAAAEEEPAEATFGDVIAAAFGPGDVATAWRRWREAGARAPDGELERLEAGVEAAQRQVSRVAAWMDALTTTEDAIRAEMGSLRRCVADAAADHATATERARACASAQLAIDVARARALPTEGSVLDADAAVLEGLARAREADARGFERAAALLSAVLDVGTDALVLCGRLRASLERVHADGTEVLHALDLDLGRLAAEARAADLGESLATGMESLRGAVGRVLVLSREGTDRLLDRLDNLAEAPDLLAPSDPERLAAESEIASLLTSRRDRS